MDGLSKTFNKFANLMDQNIRGVQIGCYSIALVGLTVALRKVRPFSKFKRPRDIPNLFIKERRELTGVVKRIEPDGALLMIEHKPLVNIPIIASGQLPVKISGVKITGLGLNWLQAIVTGHEVKFVPVLKEKNYVHCEVMLPQITKNKKETVINLGENLIKIGFGQPEPLPKTLVEDPYYKRLLAAEKYAEKKRLGVKYYIKPTKKIVGNVLGKIAGFTKEAVLVSKKRLAAVPHLSPA